METYVLFEASVKKTKFKSYYVVWKQKGKEKSERSGVGLNRTMQYGNSATRKESDFEKIV